MEELLKKKARERALTWKIHLILIREISKEDCNTYA
ncbi:hypothetical protein MetMK1DRAFT_00033150 [Metallosphaera yellowstonensis MK1]|uniref:Uncharacterized protein n=1 Tax=Metallosphaera yellowstonensis MK1 TaxID=671065 RepID=H2C9P2_9CREN|nr:hypothetical protein MetMK1DRAFT_00033150 [Metallosphaera yellowstonensis MK1]